MGFQSNRQLVATKAAARTAEALEATRTEREEVESLLHEALRQGDAEALRKGVERGHAVLEHVKGAKVSATSGLARIMLIAVSRLEQFDEREDSRKRQCDYHERVRQGQAADWLMTEAQLWGHVEACNVERVNAGLKAKLPLFTRSKDGLRSSILHVACRGTSADTTDTDLASRRLATIKSLLVARAHANAVDAA